MEGKMKNNIKNLAEKTLKSFLKNKKVGFSAALLTAFMINGGIGFASNVELRTQLNSIQTMLLDKIAAQKIEVEYLLAENEEKIKELAATELNLVRKGDYYSKSIYPSTQIFFNYGYENAGKMKDRTKENYQETIKAVIAKIEKGDGIYGVSGEAYLAYKDGKISASDLALSVIENNNGFVVEGEPHSTSIELGVVIDPLRPVVPRIYKSVGVSVSTPAAPNVSVNPISVSTPVFSVSFGGITPPTVPPIPTINLGVNAPGAVSSVTIPTVTTPTVAVSPTAPMFDPSVVATPNVPVGPSTPSIAILTPPVINFNGTGFGQGTTPSLTRGSLVMENYELYTPTATIYIVSSTTATPGLSWTGNVNVTATGGATAVLTPGTSATKLTAFISDAADHSVVINGNYDMTIGVKGNTSMFVSLNPYETGHTKTTDNIYNFAGTLTLHGDEVPVGNATAILGFEHQLLANNGGGSGAFPNINNGLVTTILTNTGTIDLNSGSNMVGIQVDTEYANGVQAGFKKKPQTRNDGLIKISAGAINSIAMDFGYYLQASPNSKVFLGNIEINGTKSYGLRMKNYIAQGVPAYYNLTEVTGTKSTGTSGNIAVNGSENIGVAVFQGPTDNVADASTPRALNPAPFASGGSVITYNDPSDIFSRLNITVGGTENVGFYRSFVNNPNKMVLTSAKIEAIGFSSTATKGSLIRTDSGEIEVNIPLNIGTVGTQNAIFQAGGTGRITNKNTLQTTVTENQFYGMTAGEFIVSGTTGATIDNQGTIKILGTDSIAMAVDVGNTGYNSGNLEVVGQNSAAIYNLGTFNITGAPVLKATGRNSAVIFNKGSINATTPAALQLTADNGASGIFSDGTGTLSSANGLNVAVNNTSLGSDRGIGIYTRGSGTVSFNNSTVNVSDGQAGIVSDGTALSMQNSTITFNNNGLGALAYAIYTNNGGTINLTNSTINVSGNSIGIEIDYASGSPSVNLTGTTLNTSGSAIGFSLKNNPGLNISDVIGGIQTLTGMTTYAPTGNTISILDGGKLFINQTIEEGETAATSPGNIFYNRLSRQRSIINVGENTTVGGLPTVTPVSGVIVSATSSNPGQIVGIQNSSSNNAINNTNTQINLKNNASVIADRLNSGNGGVGLYTNFGQINIENGSRILIETGDGVGLPAVPMGTPNILNDQGVGVFGVNGSDIKNEGLIKVNGDKGTGIIGMAYRKLSLGNAGAEFKTGGITIIPGQGTIDIENDTTGIITTTGEGSVGMYVEGNLSSIAGDPIAVATATNKGLVNVNGDNSVGIYLDGATFTNNAVGIVSTGATSGDKAVGIYGKNGSVIDLAGTLKIGTNGIGVIPFDNSTSANISINGTLSLENAVVSDTTSKIGISYNNVGTVVLNGVSTPTIDVTGLDNGTGIYVKDADVTSNVDIILSGNNRGIYIDGTGNTVTIGGNIDISDESVGIYSNGNNTIRDANLIAKDDGSAGIYINGSSTLEDISVRAQDVTLATDSVVGIFGVGGQLTSVDGDANGVGIALETGNIIPGSDIGTGMFLTDGATVTGAKITLKNNSTQSNAGIYYKKGSGLGTVSHGTDIEFLSGNTVGLYVDGGIIVNNANSILYNGGNDKNIGAFVSGMAKYVSSSMTDIVSDTNSAGLVVGNGIAENTGTLTVNNATSTAMAAIASLATDVGEALNTGIITVTSGVGMLADSTGYLGTSKVINNGTITVTSGAGIALKDSHSFISGTGTINAQAGTAAIYLSKTGTGQMTGFSSVLNLASGSVGIYANESVLDVPINLSSATTGAIGVYAIGSSSKVTQLKENINASLSTSTVGVYVGNEYVTFDNKIISAGITAAGLSSVSVYLANTISDYTVDNVTLKAEYSGSVGLYAGATTTKYGANTLTVVDNNGIGIYVPNGATLETRGGKIDVYTGIGVVLATGSTGNIGTVGGLTVEFMGTGATAIFNDGGTLNLGGLFTTIGTGSLIATTNGNLSSGATINVVGSTAILGNYTSGGPYTVENTPTGIINVTNGGVGLAAIGVSGAAIVTIKNDGTISATGKSVSNNPSVGMYSTIAEIINNETIDVGIDGVAIVANGTNQSITSNQINLNSANAIGMVASGIVGTITNGTITAIADETIGFYLDTVQSPNINLGTTTLLKGSVGVSATGAGIPSTISGNITVGDSIATKTSVGVYANNGAQLNLNPTATISVGDNGIAVAAKNAGTVINGVDVDNITLGSNGVYVYVENGGTIGLSGAGNITADGSIGVMIDGTGNVSGLSNIIVLNGGIGAYFIGASSPISTITLNAGTASKYSIGAIYKNISGAIALPTITQNGSYTIGVMLEDTSATLALPIVIGNATDTNQIGLYAKGILGTPVTEGLNNVNVSGDENIGVYSEYANITSGAITVGNSTNTTTASVGVYAKKGSLQAASISVGEKSIGVYGEDLTSTGIQILGPVVVDKEGIGIYSKNTGTGTGAINVSGIITAISDKAMGIYGQDTDINVTLIAPDTMTVGANTAVGILSEGIGNVTFNGDATVANKGTGTGSIAIYKNGDAGTITTNGNIDVGEGGYGLYIDSTAASTVVVNNNAHLILGESAVGIFADGTVNIINTGDIQVGTTYLGPSGDHTKIDEHKNSVGMYLLDGATVVNASGTTIRVNEDHSVGAYLGGVGTTITNNGLIEVSNGGVGIFVRDGATAINATTGIINIISPAVSSEGEMSIGIAAYGANVINHGIINAYDGIGILLGSTGNTLVNTGTINIRDGIGIKGNVSASIGHVVTTGTGIEVSYGDSGKAVGDGDVRITEDNKIIIDGSYVTIGGVLTSSKPIILDGPYVDITHFNHEEPLFTAPDVSGTVKLTPNFATLGNGYLWRIEDFAKSLTGTASKITISTSPLFLPKVDERDGSLIIAKEAYSSLVIGDQFDALYDGLDSILRQEKLEGSASSGVLMGLNAYLDGIYQTAGTDKSAFYKEAARTLAETRGDVYATIQQRMQNIQSAFDGSFYELLDSYNNTKNTGKYSVIYKQGSYSDDTIGIDDYDYRVQGLYYMNEQEGRNYGSKWGYSFGFAVSRFDFDDAPTYGDKSKENVYSVRAGVHFVKNFSDEDSFRLISRLEAGYNRHQTERTMELDRVYKNEGEYDSYQVTFDSKLEKTLLRTLSSKVDIYAGIGVEYGKFGKFTESTKGDSGLTLDVNGHDYLSAQPEIGIKGEKRVHVGNKLSAKLIGSVAYAHELGDNYTNNKARINEGTEGTYNLSQVEKEKGIIKVKAGIALEKANHYGVTFDVEVRKHGNKDRMDVAYGVGFNYKFN
jgi:hypothetical protein